MKRDSYYSPNVDGKSLTIEPYVHGIFCLNMFNTANHQGPLHNLCRHLQTGVYL